MNRKINIIFLFVVSVSLYARERTPIPAGRFEAITGIKVTAISANNQSGDKNFNLVWNKYMSNLKPASNIFLSEEFTNILFPASMNFAINSEKSKKLDYDSAIIAELTHKDDWLIKTLRKNAVIFLKSDQSLKELVSITDSLGLKIFFYSGETGEYLLKKI